MTSTPVDWWGLLRDPVFLADPHTQLAALREQNDIHYDAESNCYFVLGHRAFSDVMRSPSIGRDSRKWKNGWFSDPDFAVRDPVAHELFTQFQPQMINTDPPDHARMRGVYEPAFRAQAIAALVALIESETESLIADLPEDTPFNLIERFAQPLPLNVLCRLFDIPLEMANTVKAWSKALIQVGDLMMTDQQKQDGLTALKDFKAYLKTQLAQRRTGPSETSLMRLALDGLDSGQLDEDETLTNLASILIAGHETTVTLIGNGLMLFLQQPDQLARLRADLGLARQAVDEVLRFEPGGNFLLRIALEDCEISGTQITQGAPVIGLLRATNRDPNRFSEPHNFDITRTGNAHHTFGGGIHFCLGAPLARLEGRIAFEKLVAAFSSITLTAEPKWLDIGTNARSLEDLIVTVKRASAPQSRGTHP
ncbi:MAG: cytochrome P450 [Pseudomonadota bacterium]